MPIWGTISRRSFIVRINIDHLEILFLFRITSTDTCKFIEWGITRMHGDVVHCILLVSPSVGDRGWKFSTQILLVDVWVAGIVELVNGMQHVIVRHSSLIWCPSSIRRLVAISKESLDVPGCIRVCFV